MSCLVSSRGWSPSLIKLFKRLLLDVQSLLISLVLAQTILVLCLEKIAMIPYHCTRYDVEIEDSLKGTPTIFGGILHGGSDLLQPQVWQRELMSMHLEPLFMNNCRTLGLWTTLVLRRRKCSNETWSWK